MHFFFLNQTHKIDKIYMIKVNLLLYNFVYLSKKCFVVLRNSPHIYVKILFKFCYYNKVKLH